MKSKIIDINKGRNKKAKQKRTAINIEEMDTNDILKIILEGQEELKTDVSGLKKGQEELKTDVSGLKKGQEELKTDVAALKEGQARLEERQERLENKVEHLENKVEHLENKVDNLDNKVNSIDDSVKVIEAEFKPNFKALAEAFTMHIESHEEKEAEWKQTMNEIHEMYVTMNQHIAKEEKNKINNN